MQAQTATFWIATSLSLLAMTSGVAVAAINIPFTINLSEIVVVTGTPRIAVDVGGNTRYATYTSGTGTNALTFTLSPNIGDVDLDGVTVSSPIDLNGGTIKDTSGNDATLTFTPPNTSGIKINYPSLGMDFTNGTTGRYTLNGTVYNDLSSFLTASGGTFSRNSIATYFDSAGILQTASANTPRFDYDPVTHVAKGILIEESRTNSFKYSAQFENAYWFKSSIGVTPDIDISSDGGMNGDYLYATNPSSAYPGIIGTEAVTSGRVYVVSLRAKAAEWSNVNIQAFGLPGPTIISSISCSLTLTSYSICKLPFNTGSYSSVQIRILFSGAAQTWSGTKGFYLWGAQLEQGTFSTSYIPTTTAAVTRAADTLTLPSSPWSSTNGRDAVFAQLDAQIPQPSWASIFSPGLSYSGNKYFLLGSNGTISGGYSGTNITTTAVASSFTPFKAGTSFTSTNTYTALNGSVTTGPAVGSSSPASTGIGVGDVKYLNGHLQILKYYPLPLSDTQLQLLTQ